jgi:predicted secreted protein
VNIVTGIVVYQMLWWLTFFMVLPWGIQVEEKPTPGFADSAPKKPQLKLKLLITTLVSAVAWFCVYFIIESDIISFRN